MYRPRAELPMCLFTLARPMHRLPRCRVRTLTERVQVHTSIETGRIPLDMSTPRCLPTLRLKKQKCRIQPCTCTDNSRLIVAAQGSSVAEWETDTRWLRMRSTLLDS